MYAYMHIYHISYMIYMGIRTKYVGNCSEKSVCV